MVVVSAAYPSGPRGRIANPLFVGSNPTAAFWLKDSALHSWDFRGRFFLIAVSKTTTNNHQVYRLSDLSPRVPLKKVSPSERLRVVRRILYRNIFRACKLRRLAYNDENMGE